MKVFIIILISAQILSCEKKQFANEINFKTEKKVKELRILDAGGPEYPPFILLKIEKKKAVKYQYDEKLLLKDSTVVSGEKHNKYVHLIQKIPREFISGSGGNFSSPVDNSGLLFVIQFDDNSINQWGIFNDDFQYSAEIQNFTNETYLLIE
ncbi:hypothetical protein [Kaistella carnis]|uniref:Uncharacterized protein n=1 Tax=Kaistella carnis TaxID=1241979 RepID=A0A3G8Y189_9FLAO|nr:hypothetical protein [Kaistella carnis]AZI34316.1 hypothetical protein EIB73_14520 [Kaistella carnis]